MTPSPVILLYHRVSRSDSDPFGLGVSPDNFRQHLKVIRDIANPVSLEELVRQSDRGPTGERRVAVTFDDGYADVIHAGLPDLTRLDIPTTFFVTTETLGRKEFWWDELEKLILQPTRLPERLQITVADHAQEWYLGEAGPSWPECRISDPTWRAWFDEAPSTRHSLYAWLWRGCQALPQDQRRVILDELREAAGGETGARESHWSMTLDEVLRLPEEGPFSVGAHTVSHPRLASLSVSDQRAEILGSKRWLEDLLRSTVNMFSYPYGGSGDYTRETIEVCKEAGFELACINGSGSIDGTTNRLTLPRLFVQDWSGDEFERRLSAT